MLAVCFPILQAGCHLAVRFSAFSLNLRLKYKKMACRQAESRLPSNLQAGCPRFCKQAAFDSARRLSFSLHARCMTDYLNKTWTCTLELWPAKKVQLGFGLEVRLPTSIHLRARGDCVSCAEPLTPGLAPPAIQAAMHCNYSQYWLIFRCNSRVHFCQFPSDWIPP